MSFPSKKELAVVGGATATAAVAGPVAVTTGVGLLGFGTGGITAGSWAAGFMASYGGTVASGSACAVLQSVGAAGLGVVGVGAFAAVGGVAVVGAYGTYKGVQWYRGRNRGEDPIPAAL